MPNIPVTFAAIAADGATATLSDTATPATPSTDNTLMVMTNSAGVATTYATANDKVGGPYEVRAAVAVAATGMTAAVFMLTNSKRVASDFCFPVVGKDGMAVVCL